MRRILLWNYPRTSWQYDLIVVAILLFIFATPRSVFRDQPRPRSVALLPPQGNSDVFWIEPELLTSVAEADRANAAARLLDQQGSRGRSVVRLEPVFGADREVRGYMAFTKP